MSDGQLIGDVCHMEIDIWCTLDLIWCKDAFDAQHIHMNLKYFGLAEKYFIMLNFQMMKYFRIMKYLSDEHLNNLLSDTYYIMHNIVCQEPTLFN